MQFTTPTTITIDGTEHQVSSFSETVQRLVEIHTTWRNDLTVERLDVAKTEAAIRGLDTELSGLVAKELADKAAADAAATAAVVTEVPAAANDAQAPAAVVDAAPAPVAADPAAPTA